MPIKLRSIDPEFLELMPLSVKLKAPASVNGDGETTYGAFLFARCHIQYTGRQVTDANSVVRTEEGVAYLDGVYAVDTQWGLEVPSVTGNRPVTVISVEQNADEDGYHHTALHFGAF